MPNAASPPSGQVIWQAADTQGIAQLTLHHPGKLNALNRAMWLQLRAVFDGLSAAGTALPRVIVVRGAGGQFVAGGDIEEFPEFRYHPETLAAFHEDAVAPALDAMLACDVPLIAHIEGACVGGGLEIAACCDLRLCATDSRFGVPIAKLGFPMAPREIEIVARVVGETVLRELLLEARILDAQEARERGLVTRVLADNAALADEVARCALRIAQLSPQALRLNKQALRQFAHPPRASSLAERLAHFAYAPSAEHREGLAAFNERRPPRFDAAAHAQDDPLLP